MTLAALIKLLTFLESLLLGIWTVKRDPDSKRSLLFAGYMFVVAAQSFVEFQLCQAGSEAAFLFWKHFDVFILIAIAFLFHFAAEYAGVLRAMGRVPLGIVHAILGGATLIDAIWGVAPSAEFVPGVGYLSLRDPLSMTVYTMTVVLGCVFALATIALFVFRFIRAGDRRTRIQSALMLGCMALLVAAGTAIEIAALFGVHTTLALSAVSSFLLVNPFLAAAMFHYDILDISPRAVSSEILRSMSDGVVLTDGNGIVRYFNPALSEMFELDAPELMGKPLHALPWGVESLSVERSDFEQIDFLRGGEDMEAAIREPSGRIVPVSVSSTPVVQGGETVGCVVIFRDVSHRKEMEDVKQSVEKMMRHDLKNALTGILGFSELMQDSEGLTEYQRRNIGIIHKSGEMMLSQIEGYLALQRMESGTFEVESLPADVMELARDVRRNLQKLCDARGTEIVLRLNGEIPAPDKALFFPTQYALFFGMLMNLAKNAVEASRDGTPVTLDVERDASSLTVRIHNSGAIPREIKDRFFEKFVTFRKKNGTGLGAYSAKLIAESLGGTIRADSSESEGTTVTVRFPMPG